MKRLANRYTFLTVTILLLISVGILYLANMNESESGRVHRLDEGAPNITIGVQDVLVEDLASRPAVPKELKAAMSLTRGRIPGTGDVPGPTQELVLGTARLST